MTNDCCDEDDDCMNVGDYNPKSKHHPLKSHYTSDERRCRFLLSSVPFYNFHSFVVVFLLLLPGIHVITLLLLLLWLHYQHINL